MSLASSLESFWYKNSIVTYLLWPLSFFVSLIAKLKRWLYRANICKSYQSGVPTLVVGNITVGGTGKTPVICELVEYFKERGVRVGIVSRGYHSQITQGAHLVSLSDSAKLIGDEANLLFNRLKVPFAIGPKRAEAARVLTENHKLDLIVSDDGLQHYQLARDFELLMIDGQRYFGNGLMLPFGPLRESVARINTVDAIVVNSPKDMLSAPESAYQARIIVDSLVHLKSGESVSLSNLHENSVTAICGIGNPVRFYETLKPYKEIFERMSFDDHHHFVPSDLDGIQSDIVVMTEKDAAKCKEFAKDSWYYLKVNMKLDASLYEKINQKLNLFKEH